MPDNGLVALVNKLLSNGTVAEVSTEINNQLNEIGLRFAAGGLSIAANGQMHIHDFLVDTLTIGVLADTTIVGFANVSGSLQVGGLSTQTGNATFGGFINSASSIQVAGTGLFNGLLTANAGATVNGAFTVKSTITANGSLGTAGYVLTSGASANAYWTNPASLSVSAALTANDAAHLNGQLAAFYQNADNINAGTLAGVRMFVANSSVNGAISTAAQTIAGDKTLTGNTVANNLSFTGNVTSSMNVTGDVIATGNVAAGAAKFVGWTGRSQLASAANGSLSVFASDGSTLANLNANLITGNAGIFNGLLTANASANVNGTFAVSGLTTLTGNTTLSGYCNVGQTMNVAGISNFTGNATFGGFANIASTLRVASTTLLNGALTCNAALTVNGAVTVNGTYVSTTVADGNSGTSKTIDLSLGMVHELTLTGSVTLTLNNPIDGGRYIFKFGTGAGSFTVTWPAAVLWSGGTAPTITATASKVDIVTLIYFASTSKYYGAFSQNY